MTLENAVKSLMKSIFQWIEVNKDKEAQLIINFPSLFVHYSKNILRNVEEFKDYYKLNSLKPKYLNFNFSDGKLEYIQWLDDKAHKFNELVAKEIIEYYNKKNYSEIIKSENSLKISEKEEKLLDLQALNDFKF